MSKLQARRAGSSNRRNRIDLAKDIQNAIRKHLPDLDKEYDPIIEMALVGANPRVSPELRVAANREVAGYIYHKLKAIDLTISQDGPITIQVVDFSKIGPDTNPMRLIEGQRILEGMLDDDEDDNEGES